jgi:hypothetical protein
VLSDQSGTRINAKCIIIHIFDVKLSDLICYLQKEILASARKCAKEIKFSRKWQGILLLGRK